MTRSVIMSDLGGVVLRLDTHRCLECWSKLTSLTAHEVAERLAADGLHDAFERGEVSKTRFLAHVRERLETKADDDALVACYSDIYLGIDRATLALLADQHDAGHRLVALTNTNEIHHARWWPMYREPLQLFAEIYLSFELGSRKPDTDCFEAVLAAEHVRARDIVFIDDVAEHVDAAQSLGIAAIHFTSAEQLAHDLPRALARSG